MDNQFNAYTLVQHALYFDALKLSKPIRVTYKTIENKSATVISDVDTVINREDNTPTFWKITGSGAEVYYMDVNSSWYESAEEWEIKFILRYETRRIYQIDQIGKLNRGESVSTDENTIRQWEDNYKNYIPDTKAKRHEHFNQACEIDAYAYAKFMEAFEMRNADDSRIATPKNYSYPYSKCSDMEKVIEDIVDRMFEKRFGK